MRTSVESGQLKVVNTLEKDCVTVFIYSDMINHVQIDYELINKDSLFEPMRASGKVSMLLN